MKLKEKIYFYCCPYKSPEKAAFQHAIISIAEGLQELGIEFYSNIKYWKLSPSVDKYLFNNSRTITPDDCDAVVLDNEWFTYGLEMPKDLFHVNRKYVTIYIDSDGLYAYYLKKEFRNFDIILRTQYNRKLEYPPNIAPWAFGLSNRIIEYTQVGLSYSARKKSILNNFRVPQQVREIANRSFIPIINQLFPVDISFDRFNNKPVSYKDRMLWEQTGRRHYLSYYEKLKSTAFCCCFAGIFVFPFPPNVNSIFFKILNSWNLNTVKYGIPTKAITQFDGWRFWETLASGCIAIHADFEEYGIQLPVMPENFRHYIGIDFNNLEKSFQMIKNKTELLPYISKEGKKWALQFYSPKAVAKRFIQYVRKLKTNRTIHEKKSPGK